MKRSQFLKNIIGLFGIAALPTSIKIKQFRNIYLLQSFIKGFQYYEGLRYLDEMKEGDMLELVREPDNQYDDYAVALHFNKQKIGFLPKEENVIISKLLDAEVIPLYAEITHLKKKAKSWENVHIAIYVLKEVEEPLPEYAAYLTMLETPRYRSVKISKERVVNIYDDYDLEEQMIDTESALQNMIGKHENGRIFNKQDTGAEYTGKIDLDIKEGRLLVNKYHLPSDLSSDTILETIKEGGVKLDSFFDEEGYAVANVNRVSELAIRIERVVNVTDKLGRNFIEILLC